MAKRNRRPERSSSDEPRRFVDAHEDAMLFSGGYKAADVYPWEVAPPPKDWLPSARAEQADSNSERAESKNINLTNDKE